MQLVKVGDQFYQECKKQGTDQEMLYNKHGVHYIKLFPINSKYIQRYRIENNAYMQGIKSILDKNEKNIIVACQNYLYEYEQGKRHPNTPDIDGILAWL